MLRLLNQAHNRPRELTQLPLLLQNLLKFNYSNQLPLELQIITFSDDTVLSALEDPVLLLLTIYTTETQNFNVAFSAKNKYVTLKFKMESNMFVCGPVESICACAQRLQNKYKIAHSLYTDPH